MRVNNCNVNKEWRAKVRGCAFVSLFAAAWQLTTAYPGRYPYLEYEVKHIEALGLASKLDCRG